MPISNTSLPSTSYSLEDFVADVRLGLPVSVDPSDFSDESIQLFVSYYRDERTDAAEVTRMAIATAVDRHDKRPGSGAPTEQATAHHDDPVGKGRDVTRRIARRAELEAAQAATQAEREAAEAAANAAAPTPPSPPS